MAYSPEYTVADFTNIFFDLIVGIFAEVNAEREAIGGLILVLIILSLIGWIGKSFFKIVRGSYPYAARREFTGEIFSGLYK